MTATITTPPEYTFTTRLQPPPLSTSTTVVYPTPERPNPATNDPVFNDAMRVRHAVFVEEQHCSAENETNGAGNGWCMPTGTHSQTRGIK